MKKSLFMLGVAVAALSSCSQSEILEVAEGRAIGFSSFVNNNTRAVNEVTDLSQYYVFGNYGSAVDSDWSGQIFNNELSSVEYYWQPNMIYRFGAYADGNGGKIASSGDGATVSFDAEKSKLTFTNYTPDDTKDLVAAVTDNEIADTYIGNEDSKVQLNFKHMLCQVGFTFKTEVGKEYKLAISAIRINGAVSKANGSFTRGKDDPIITWESPSAHDGYQYDEIEDLADEKNNNQNSQYKLVIPQSVPTEKSQITVTFTAKITGGGLPEGGKEKSFTADLTSPDSEGWKPGYRYNYTTTINGNNIDENQKKIEFTATVSDWENAEMGDSGSLKPLQSGN